MKKLNSRIRKSRDYEFNTNQLNLILNGILSSGYNILIFGVFLTGYALWLGATDAQAGMIMSIIYMANILQLLLVRLWQTVKREKSTIIFFVLFSRLILIGIIGIPFMNLTSYRFTLPLFGQMNGSVFLFYCIFIVGMFFGSSSGVKLNLWMMSHLPRHMRGNFFTVRNRSAMIVTLIFSLAAGQFLDYMNKAGYQYRGFLIIFITAAIFAIIDSFTLGKIDFFEEGIITKRDKKSSLSILKPFKDIHFLNVLIYQIIWTMGINISIPFLTVYMIKQLGISYSNITILSVLQVLFSAFLIKQWGLLANRHRWVTILNISLLLFVFQLIIWLIIIPSSSYLLPVVFILAGIFGPAYNMSTFNLPYSHLKKKDETVYMSVNTTIISAAGMVGIFIGGKLLEYEGNFISITDHYMEKNIIITVVLLLIAIVFSFLRMEKRERNES
ncbi:MAG: MFS transporter [Spirochaetaceae bacterium]